MKVARVSGTVVSTINTPIFEDRRLEIPSELAISVDAQMARIGEALGLPT